VKKFSKANVIFILTAVFLTTSIVTATGALIQRTIEVGDGVKIFVDGNEVIIRDSNGDVAETFVYNGRTYAPTRAIAEALGREVTWDENLSRVNISTNNALLIKEQGNFSAGGTVVASEGTFDPMQPWMVPQGGQTRHGDHADVLYQIPENENDYSMVFLHGYGQSRRSWQTTADGREGFSNIFLRNGYSVYLVDQPGRGQAGQVTGAGEISAAPDDQTWFTQFRIGLWPDFNEGVQFPKDDKSLDQFFRMMVPDTGTTANRNATVTAMSDIFDRTGSGILFTHSASGGTGWQTAIANENVKAIVSIEPGGFAFPIDPNADSAQSFGGVEMDDFMKLTKIPIIVYYGDYIPDEETGIPSQDFWRQSLTSARQWAELVNSNGGDVTIVHLPELGIKGNTHFIMSDLNNKVIAQHIADWLNEKGLK